jgi:serine/threonine-protein kinase RsbT
MSSPKQVAIRSDLDIVIARSSARDTAKQIGFGAVDQARIATAVSELARNIFLYAGGGTVCVSLVEQRGLTGIEIVCEDQGPGIADLAQVMQDGYSTSRGMGMGLPGARRLMDEFELQSQEGLGTRVTCRKWRR